MSTEDVIWDIVENTMILIDEAANDDVRLPHYWKIVQAAKEALELMEEVE